MTENRGDAAGDGEERLFEQFLNGDDDAFKQLEACYTRPLLGYFRRLNCTPEDGEDLLQETLLRVVLLRDADPARKVRCFRGFVFRVATNVYLSHVRSERSRRARDAARPLSVSPVDPVDGEPPIPVDDLLAAIRALRWPYRDYLLLCGRHGLGELTHEEIAATLEMQAQNVGRISGRAVRLLREELMRRGVTFE